jgi:hypothetical protein
MKVQNDLDLDLRETRKIVWPWSVEDGCRNARTTTVCACQPSETKHWITWNLMGWKKGGCEGALVECWDLPKLQRLLWYEHLCTALPTPSLGWALKSIYSFFFVVKRKSISSAKRLYKKNHLPCFLQSKDVIVLLQLLPSTTCYVIVLQLLPSLRWTWNAGPRAMQFTLFLLPPFPGDDLVATHDTRL